MNNLYGGLITPHWNEIDLIHIGPAKTLGTQEQEENLLLGRYILVKYLPDIISSQDDKNKIITNNYEDEKAKQWLDDNNIEYELRDIKLNNPTLDELTQWCQKSGLPLKKFFNTSGLLYKSLNLKNKLPEMSENEKLSLLSTDGMLVKRPLLISDNFVLVGFKETEWKENAKDGI